MSLCRVTTVPSRTKGKRKVQIKLPNCQALQPEGKAVPGSIPVSGTGTGVGIGMGTGEGKGVGDNHHRVECPEASEMYVL